MIYKTNLNEVPKTSNKDLSKTTQEVKKQNIFAVKKENKAKDVKEPKKRRFKVKYILIPLFLLLFIAFGLFAFDRIQKQIALEGQFSESGSVKNVCKNILNPECWTESFRPKLKEENGFTSALIIGTDTRKDGGGLMNTDSLIIASLNHKTKEVMLTSIPRDFWSHTYNTKINAVYAFTFQKGKQKYNDEFYYLKEEITKVTQKKIQYVVKVRFDGVIGLVDKIGGVEICPKDSFNVKYPKDDAKRGEKQWLSYKFEKGCQEINGEKALVYSRFRYLYSGPGYLASDFSRADRQQEVLEAIKTKLLSEDSGIQKNAELYWSLFQSLNGNIEADITIEDILATLSLIDDVDRDLINTKLDPNFGGLNSIIYTDSNPSQGYTIKAKVKDYSIIHKELQKIWDNSAFYKEHPTILVRNKSGEKALPKDHIVFSLQTKPYLSSFKVINEAKAENLIGITLFDFTDGKKNKSLEVIKKALDITEVKTLPEEYGIARSDKKEDFLIVVGPTPTPTPTSTEM